MSVHFSAFMNDKDVTKSTLLPETSKIQVQRVWHNMTYGVNAKHQW